MGVPSTGFLLGHQRCGLCRVSGGAGCRCHGRRICAPKKIWWNMEKDGERTWKRRFWARRCFGMVIPIPPCQVLWFVLHVNEFEHIFNISHGSGEIWWDPCSLEDSLLSWLGSGLGSKSGVQHQGMEDLEFYLWVSWQRDTAVKNGFRSFRRIHMEQHGVTSD